MPQTTNGLNCYTCPNVKNATSRARFMPSTPAGLASRIFSMKSSAILTLMLSFGPEHFRHIVSKFGEYPDLGVAGAPFREGSFQYDYRFTNIENVWGGCQLFRKQCFEDIGGYTPVKGGCIDHIAVVSARMKGWKTRTFTETVSIHHRIMGTAQTGGLGARFKYGAKDYSVGNHPVWQLSRAVYQMKQRPVVVGGIALASGYFWSMIRRVPRPVSHDLVEFSRSEQMRRLSRFVGSRLLPRATERSVGRGSLCEGYGCTLLIALYDLRVVFF